MSVINVNAIIASDAFKDAFKCTKNGFRKIKSFVTLSVEHLSDIMLNIYIIINCLLPFLTFLSTLSLTLYT